jgi:hypothetical protein
MAFGTREMFLEHEQKLEALEMRQQRWRGIRSSGQFMTTDVYVRAGQGLQRVHIARRAAPQRSITPAQRSITPV